MDQLGPCFQSASEFGPLLGGFAQLQLVIAQLGFEKLVYIDFARLRESVPKTEIGAKSSSLKPFFTFLERLFSCLQWVDVHQPGKNPGISFVIHLQIGGQEFLNFAVWPPSL